mmetsp:Transcript_5319/g.8062  ORF Transcript_5319/g.8062 Transcript_5319/m.8062 type:complete len:156 (+) Transcript_5319:1003-1470(+)
MCVRSLWNVLSTNVNELATQESVDPAQRLNSSHAFVVRRLTSLDHADQVFLRRMTERENLGARVSVASVLHVETTTAQNVATMEHVPLVAALQKPNPRLVRVSNRYRSSLSTVASYVQTQSGHATKPAQGPYLVVINAESPVMTLLVVRVGLWNK